MKSNHRERVPIRFSIIEWAFLTRRENHPRREELRVECYQQLRGRNGMRIGIISDTHGSVKAWQDALQGPFQNVQQIWHGGDVLYHGPRNPFPPEYDPGALARLINSCSIPVLATQGNCDSEVDQMVLDVALQSPYFLVEHPVGRVLVTHGHRYSIDLIESMIQRFKVKVWVSGHTHEPILEQRAGIIFLNPGSPSLPKGEWPRRSVAVLTSTAVKLFDLDQGQPYQTLLLEG